MLAARYHAFISYAHEDRDHAQWLVRAIESYTVPKSLRLPDDAPRRLKPLFLDRFELRADGPLDAQLAEAMRRSDALIVICSPRAVASGRVDEEIRAFTALGRSARIFPVMVSGHPLAESRGYDAAAECFPAALRELSANPIAADARGARSSRRDAVVRLVASLLGVRLDELQRRDERRRSQRLMVVAAASLCAAVITSALGAAAWIARAEAERERQRAEHTARFLTSLLEGADPGRALGRELTARELVDEGAVLLQGKEVPADLRADMRVLLASVYGSLGVQDKSRQFLDTALAEMATTSPDSASYAAALELRAYQQQTDGQLDAAMESQRHVIRIREQLEDRAGVAAARSFLGAMLTDAARPDEARAELQFALREQLQLYPNGDRELVQTYNRVATEYQERKDMREAVRNFERALEAARQVHGPIHPGVAIMLNNLALAHKYARNFPAADSLYRESIAMRQRLYGAEHPAVAMALNNLAALRRDAGDEQGALAVINEALAMNRRLYGERHPQVALNLYNLGLTYTRLKQFDEALKAFDQSIDQRREFFGPDHPRTGQAIASKGVALMSDGRTAQAHELLAETVRIYSKKYGVLAPQTVGMRAWFAETALSAKRYAQARDEFAEVYAHCDDGGRGSRLDCGSFALGAAEAELTLGDLPATRRWLDLAARDVPPDVWRASLVGLLQAELDARVVGSEQSKRFARQQLARLEGDASVPPYVVARARARIH